MARLLTNGAKRQTVVITGASAGVGRALALRFARGGGRVGLIARDLRSLAAVAEEVTSLGGRAAIAAADVADANAVFAAAQSIARKLGPIDIWINNAMATVFSSVAEISPAEFRRVTEVTYLGSVHGTMAALRHMRARGSGTIVQVGSSLSYRGIPLQSAYCGAKYAIRGFLDSLRAELIHDGSGIRLTMVQLPAVNTPQFDWARTHRSRQPRPVPPVVQPEAVADAIFRAAHGSRREYWVGLGTAKVIVGSLLLPSLLDRYLARNAYEAQDRPAVTAPDRPDNLEQPVHALHRTHGSFDREAGRSAALLSGAGVRIVLATVGIIVLLLIPTLLFA